MNLLAKTFPNVGRVVVGSLVDGDSVYKIGQDANGDTFIEEFQNLPDEAEPAGNHESDAGAGEYDTASDTTAAEATIEGGNIIMDIMLVWTKNAECRNSGLSRGCSPTAQTTANMEARLNLAIEETNTAFALSDINARLRLVHAYRHPDYVEASSDAFRSALYGMQNPSDGIMDDVHPLRTQYGADLVAMIIDDSQYCGLGYLGPSKSYGFSVTAWNCATGYYTFGHEVGHNLGCYHDVGTSSACDTTNFNYGYRDPQASFRTILAYNCQMGQCDNMPKSGCSRTQRFSNPNQITSTGSPWGAANANNAQHINNVAAAVSGWYPPTTPTTTTSTTTTTAEPTTTTTTAKPTTTTPTPTCSTNADCDVCSGSTCQNGECAITSTPLTCDDNNACTVDTCDATFGGCVHTPIDRCCQTNDDCASFVTGNTCSTATCDISTNTCKTVPTFNCCGNGICESGENCSTCSEDCIAGTSTKTAVCGNGICEASNGENCHTCALDCAGRTGGKPSSRFCCGGDSTDAIGCSDDRCNTHPFQCTTEATPTESESFCCGDGTCNGDENESNCSLDCIQCGDGVCNGNETFENCPGDCTCGNVICEAGESGSCPGDCCGDGFCGDGENPFNCSQDCQCLPSGAACSSDSDCCNGCQTKGKNAGTCK